MLTGMAKPAAMARMRRGRAFTTPKPPSRMSATVMGRSATRGIDPAPSAPGPAPVPARAPGPPGPGGAPGPRASPGAGWCSADPGTAQPWPVTVWSSIGAIIAHHGPRRLTGRSAMEGYGPSTYGDRFADVYDEWYPDVSDAAATVARVAALAGGGGPAGVSGVSGGAGPVLELGAGSGRLAVPLADLGLDVWALDASAAMLDRLAAKPGGDRVHAVVGDMADLDLGPEAPAAFAVVLCAFNTLFNLTDVAA